MEHTNTHHEKEFSILINSISIAFTVPKVTGKEILEKAGFISVECHSLYQKLKGCDFELIRPEDVVDLSHPDLEHFVTKDPIVFNYTINQEPESTDKKTLTPTEILKLAAINTGENYLAQHNPDGTITYYAYNPDEPIKMVCPGMKFISVKWVDIVDIEEYGKQCKEVPIARQYRIKIDKNYHLVNGPHITGQQLLELENKTPIEKYNVLKFLSGTPKPQLVGLKETVDLTEKCLIRFVLQPREQKDGREIRRNFFLPEEDTEFLNKQNIQWETISSGGMWLILHDYPVPEGYNVASAEVALMIPPSYPVTQIDMAYFFPQLQKKSGRVINATTPQVIEGRTFQRWSRHRLPGEWVPGLDNVSTHLCLVDNWLVNDLNR